MGIGTRRLRGSARWAIAALLIAMPCAAGAELLPNPQQVATPEERPVLRELVELVLDHRRGQPPSLARLDPILAQLRRPTRLRGLVQYFRAVALDDAGRRTEAQDALDESIRLLPGHSAPLFAAAEFAAYSDRGADAVAYLLRASRIDPDLVRQVPDYEVRNLLSRVSPQTDGPVRRALVERLFEIGWRGQSLGLRSSLAREVITARVGEGNVAQAAGLVPHLVDPRDAYILLTQNRAQPLWEQIEEWAGPRQERLWPTYLREMRAQWTASRDQQLARDYIQALEQTHRYQQMIDDFLPLFSNPDRERDYDLQWIAVHLSNALARLDRWDEAEEIFTRSLRVWPAGSDANALNLLANRARLRYYRGDSAGAVADLRTAIADARRRRGEVSRNALIPMHFFLACALRELGRDAEAVPSIANVVGGGNSRMAAQLHLCFGRHDAARDVLLDALADEDQRAQVIEFLQIENEPPMPSHIGRTIHERRQALREDERLIAALAPHGRVLPYRLGAGATPRAVTRPGT